MRRLSQKGEGILAINLAAIIFGTAALYGKLDVSPIWIVGMRSIFASLALAVLGKLTSRLRLPAPASRKSLFLTGLILAAHWLTFFASVQLSGIAVATLTFAAFPLFTVLFEAMRRRRRPALSETFCCLVIIFAVAVLFDADFAPSQSLGALSGLVSAATFAVFGIASKELTQSEGSLVVSLFQNLVVTFVLVPFLPVVERSPHTGGQWLSLILLGVVTTALMHQLYLFSLRRLSASTCSAFVALEPLYAILFAALFLGEDLPPRTALSAALIMGTSIALTKRENRQEPSVSS